MRTRTPAASAAAARAVTRPLWLVEIAWSPISRLSSGASVTWAGHTWAGTSRLEVPSLTLSGDGNPAATLVLGNVNGAFGVLALGLDVSDVPVKIWQAHADALADADPQLVFDGVIDSTSIALEAVTLRLAAQRTASQVLPATVIGPAAGFRVLLPAGTRITAAGITTTLMR